VGRRRTRRSRHQAPGDSVTSPRGCSGTPTRRREW
jgi:hypothetical protein